MVNMWLAYGERKELAGVSLQKQTVSTYGGETFHVDIAGLVDSPVFLYELSGFGGSIGVSPHPHHWAQFISKHGSLMSTCPPGFVCPESETWERWWMFYSIKARLFTLYLANPLTMTTQHREKGVHEKAEDTKKDFDFITKWQSCWEKQNLPKQTPRLSLNLKPISDALHQARKINDKYGMVIVTILDQDTHKYYEPYQHLNSSERHRLLDQTLYIAPSHLLLPHLHHTPHRAVEKPRAIKPNRTKVEDQSWFHLYHLQLIGDLIQTDYQLVVLTVPAYWQGSADTLLQGSPARSGQCTLPQHSCIGPKIFVGRILGQTSPHMGFMLWDGRLLEVLDFWQRLQKLVMEEEFISFKRAWLGDWRNRRFLQWRWLG